MFQIDSGNSVTSMPTPAAPSGTGGWFQTTTVVSADWLNAVQNEIDTVILNAGLTLSKTNSTQLLQALSLKFASLANTRTRLSANQTFYVGPSGSDSTGTGTSGAPFASPQGAYNYLQNHYDLAGFQATIQLANGTYAPLNAFGNIEGQISPVLISGNTGTPSAVIISVSSAYAACVACNYGAILQLSGVTITSTGTGGVGLSASTGSTLSFGTLGFGGCGGAHIYSGPGSLVTILANYTIYGSATAHFQSANNGTMYSDGTSVGGITVTVSSTPTFSVAFAVSTNVGLMEFVAITFSGAATGTRYNASQVSYINTSGGGANFFPGSVAGTTANGGVYL